MSTTIYFWYNNAKVNCTAVGLWFVTGTYRNNYHYPVGVYITIYIDPFEKYGRIYLLLTNYYNMGAYKHVSLQSNVVDILQRVDVWSQFYELTQVVDVMHSANILRLYYIRKPNHINQAADDRRPPEPAHSSPISDTDSAVHTFTDPFVISYGVGEVSGCRRRCIVCLFRSVWDIMQPYTGAKRLNCSSSNVMYVLTVSRKQKTIEALDNTTK